MAGTEFDLIARFFSNLGVRREDVLQGVGDDTALLQPPHEQTLAMTTDTLIGGVHFPSDAPPESIGHKALAANLSDLAAMGAEPAWITLALTLPEVDTAWLRAFSHGLGDLARYHQVALVGGDTCRGPLSMTIQATGFVPRGRALHRHGARPGDAIYVSGSLGDAALGLRLWQSQSSIDTELDTDANFIVNRLHRPTPRVSLGLALRDCATAAIDISDGLAADLGHVLRASKVGGLLDAARLPLSGAGLRLGGTEIRQLALSGGDDYELCFTVPRARVYEIDAIASRVGVALTRVGTVEPGTGLRLRQPDSTISVTMDDAGYRHF